MRILFLVGREIEYSRNEVLLRAFRRFAEVDVVASQDGSTYRVRDVGIDLGGTTMWLAQDQQAQFESFLDRNNGKVDKLIDRIKQLLADMDARKKDGRGSAFKQVAGRSPG